MKKTTAFVILTAFICVFSVGGVFAENEQVSAQEGERGALLGEVEAVSIFRCK